MFLPLTKSVSLTETLDCGAWLGLLSDKVALNDFQMLETCLMEIEYSLSLSLDGWCPKSGLWGNLWLEQNLSVIVLADVQFWSLRKTRDFEQKPQCDCSGWCPILVPEENSTWVKNLSVMCPGWCPILVPEENSTWVKTSVWCVLVDVWFIHGESRYAVSGPGLKLDIVSIECRCCRYLGKLLVLHEEKPVEQFGGEVIEGFTEADDV